MSCQAGVHMGNASKTRGATRRQDMLEYASANADAASA
jgi:hypothetical protein